MRLPDARGVSHSLQDLIGLQLAVTFLGTERGALSLRHLTDFQERLPVFEACKTLVLGVSSLSATDLSERIRSHQLDLFLLRDPEGELKRALSLYPHTPSASILSERVTLLFDRQGRLHRSWRRVRVRRRVTRGGERAELFHADDVLFAAQHLHEQS